MSQVHESRDGDADATGADMETLGSSVDDGLTIVIDMA